jgi:PAS domain-containing protein
MSTVTNDDPIPVDDQIAFFRQIVDSSPALLHTARPDGYIDFFNRTWLDFTGEPLEKLLGWGVGFLYSSRRCRRLCADDA